MALDGNVLGTWSKLGSAGKVQAASIVLETLSMNLGLGQIKIDVRVFEFFQKVQDEEDMTGGMAQANAFSFNGAQRHQLLLLAGPALSRGRPAA